MGCDDRPAAELRAGARAPGVHRGAQRHEGLPLRAAHADPEDHAVRPGAAHGHGAQERAIGGGLRAA